MSMWAYVQIEAIPFITLLIVYCISKTRFQMYQSSQKFQILILLVLMILVVDGVNWYTVLYPREQIIWLMWFINICYFLLTEAIAYTWFLYVYEQIHENKVSLEQKRRVKKSAILLVAIDVIILLSPWNHWIFYIDAETLSYHRGAFHWLQYGFGFGFMIFASVLAYLQSRKTQLREQRNQYLFLSRVVILPLFGGILQLVNYDFVFLWPFTAAAVFLIYCDLQMQQISVDTLTSINNRGTLERYIQQQIQKNESGWYLIMMDADDFKHINDRHGHMEGDKALQIIAQALKNVFGETGAFISRYGGDEFVVISEVCSKEEIDKAIQACHEELRKEVAIRQLPYDVSVSVGYAKFESNEKTPCKELLKQADQNMYKHKALHKKKRRVRRSI